MYFVHVNIDCVHACCYLNISVFMHHVGKPDRKEVTSRDLTVMPNAAYETVEMKFKQPDHLNTVDVKQNIA